MELSNENEINTDILPTIKVSLTNFFSNLY